MKLWEFLCRFRVRRLVWSQWPQLGPTAVWRGQGRGPTHAMDPSGQPSCINDIASNLFINMAYHNSYHAGLTVNNPVIVLISVNAVFLTQLVMDWIWINKN